ncbi:hypothetical protein HU200_050318 [Digitaria exilis]|uniref:Phosphorylated adapter RNA export protein n=1 Tax=Digitaria exilis TaxID=1010633 RepID=A0A835ASK6_9POAL|nr:hypothetical protein HU200_050318 [Digitaria exilis]CAB3473318.1 unnamed protein product [Digitaria exilis]
MEEGECAMGAAAMGEETLNYYGDDIEMADAEEAPAAEVSIAAGGGGGGAQAEKGGPEGKSKKKKKRNKGKKKNKGRQDGPPTNIADINRFVLDTCKRLKEKKSYLVWNAVGCLGVTAVSDLVREVEAIQKCGGQTIADGSRYRTGGGILWNILKSREPKAYKEIMAKGKELEKQFRYTKRPQMSRNEDASSQGSALIDDESEVQEEKEVLDDPEQLDDADQLEDAEKALPSDTKAQRKPLADRIRVPVAYDDLFEEGEVHEGEPQN